jgi:uncharacterized membrane protein HdeD (DUF308 family)
MPRPSPGHDNPFPDMSPHSLTLIGGIFVILGVMAIILPVWATFAVEQLVAGLLLVWGAAGIGFAVSMRPLPEWRISAGLSVMILALGTIFLIVPQDGIETLTLVLIAAFLLEGVLSVLFAFRIRDSMRQWGWMALSGLVSVLVGLMILSGWPGTETWTLGLLFGLNFLTTGASLIALAMAVKSADRA